MALPGAIHLINSIQIEGFGQTTIDRLVADTTYSLLIMGPALILFATGYLLLEGHSYGWKLSILSSVTALLLAVSGNLNIEFALIITVLSAVAAAIEINKRRNTSVKSKDLPIVTENLAKFGLRLSGLICAGILIGMITYLAVRASPYLSWTFFTSSNWGFTWTTKVIEGVNKGSIGGLLPMNRFLTSCGFL